MRAKTKLNYSRRTIKEYYDKVVNNPSESLINDSSQTAASQLVNLLQNDKKCDLLCCIRIQLIIKLLIQNTKCNIACATMIAYLKMRTRSIALKWLKKMSKIELINLKWKERLCLLVHSSQKKSPKCTLRFRVTKCQKTQTIKRIFFIGLKYFANRVNNYHRHAFVLSYQQQIFLWIA